MRLHWRASIILAVVVLLALPYSIDAYPVSTNTSLMSSEIYESQELLTDPLLTIEPEYSVEGSSHEFSFKYNDSSSNNNDGIVSLNWTHIPGTELVFETSGIAPECQEFVYFSQEFTWDLNTLPSSLNLSLRYQITRSDSFLTQYSSGLYEIRFWFIHPDGIWQEITRFGGRQDSYRLNSHAVSCIYFEDLFEKLMIGNDHEALPAAKLAIGLVPTWRFRNDNGIPLWREFNGSVILDITEMSLRALYRREDMIVETEMPVFNNSWQVSSSDSFRDSFMASDDSLYVLAVEDLVGIGLGSTLTRVGLRGEEIWRKTWAASERLLVHSVAATTSIVYVIGTKYGLGASSDVGLYALDINGNPLWNTTLDYSASDYPGDVGINSNGEIFIGVSTTLSPERNVLIKLDSEGKILWDVFFGATQWDRVQDVEVCKNGNIYTRTEVLLSLWNDDGESLWSLRGYFDDAYALTNGDVLTTHSTLDGLVNLTSHDMAGIKKWSSSYEIEYTQDWRDLVTISSAIDGPNDTIIALLWIYGYHPGRLLLHLDDSGNQLLNRTLSFSEDLHDIYDIPQYYDMYIDSKGLLYLIGAYLDRDLDYSIVVGVYDFDGVVVRMTNSALINSSIAVALVMVVIISFESKRKLSYS